MATNVSPALEFPNDHAALRLYPSPEEWQRRIDTTKRDNPDLFDAVRADFDLAIRSSVVLYEEMPGIKAQKRAGHALDNSILGTSRVLTREDVNFIVEQARGTKVARDIEQWYHAHMEDLTVEDSDLLRVVLAPDQA